MLDWNMSPMDGEEFLEQLKLRHDAAQLPVLVMTGSGALPERQVAGVIGTVQKPDFDALVRLLAHYA